MNKLYWAIWLVTLTLVIAGILFVPWLLIACYAFGLVCAIFIAVMTRNMLPVGIYFIDCVLCLLPPTPSILAARLGLLSKISCA